MRKDFWVALLCLQIPLSRSGAVMIGYLTKHQRATRSVSVIPRKVAKHQTLMAKIVCVVKKGYVWIDLPAEIGGQKKLKAGGCNQNKRALGITTVLDGADVLTYCPLLFSSMNEPKYKKYNPSLRSLVDTRFPEKNMNLEEFGLGNPVVTTIHEFSHCRQIVGDLRLGIPHNRPRVDRMLPKANHNYS